MQNILDLSKSPYQRLKLSSILFVLGALSACAFAPLKWTICIFISYIGLYLLADLNCFWFFLGQTLTGCHWLYFSIKNYGKLPEVTAILLTLIATILIALVPTISQRIIRNNFKIILWPIWLFISETIRSYWLFSGFPWLLIGSSQIHSYCWKWLTIIGVHGASLGIAIIIACSIESYKRKNLLLLLPSLIWFICPLFITETWQNTSQQLTFETRTTSGFQEPNTSELSDSNNNIDFILWPEGVMRHTLSIDEIKSLPKNKQHALTIFGGITNSNDKFFNSTIVLYPSGQVSEHQKHHLVAFGEYWPMRKLYNDVFKAPIDLHKALPENKKLIPIKNTFILPIICYDVAFSNWMLPEIIKAGALISIHQMYWFDSKIANAQQLEFAQARSIEFAREQVFLESNTGHVIIKPNGQIINNQNTINIYQGSTPYSLMMLKLKAFMLELGLNNYWN